MTMEEIFLPMKKNPKANQLYNDNNIYERNYKRYLIFIEQVQKHLNFLKEQKEIKINA